MSEMSRFHHVVGLLKSWETGYAPPSCQMAIKDGIKLLEELAEEVADLKSQIEKLKVNAKPYREVEF